MAKLIKEPVVPKPVTIEFTPEEAQFLRDIMGKVGGDAYTSRRKHAADILGLLRTAGYNEYTTADLQGTILVTDKK